MATGSTIHLRSGDLPQYHRDGILPASTKKVSELLQENHERHHIFFNAEGFHNHIAHQMLTMWALNASPEQLQKEYEINKSYQLPIKTPDSSIVQDLHDPANFISYLGPEKHYNDYLVLFRDEIEKTSWQDVLNKYLFAGDERAETMLVRMYAGLLHPLIHLGFGIEFRQPAIIAEALAQAACHAAWIGDLFLPAEKKAETRGNNNSNSIVQLLDAIHDDTTLRNAVRWSDANKIRDGLLVRAPDRIVDYASQVHVTPENLAQKTAEMINATAYFTGGAQRSDKDVRYDFYFIHELNSSIFFSAFLEQDWLSEANKMRLLEWKIRHDIVVYASRKSPDIRLDIVREYKPKKPSGWDAVEDRVLEVEDDGHAVKLVRALAHGCRVSKSYENEDSFRIKEQDWLQLAHMAIDSVEQPGVKWVRSAGFDEAWQDIPPKANL